MNDNNTQQNKQSIHNILAHSYLVYFVFSVLGLFADTYFDFNIRFRFSETLAILFFGIGPALIIWAQYTSHRFRNVPIEEDAYFHHGPYRFLRNPTHLGLLILVTGFSLISGSLLFFVVTLVGYFLSSVFFQRYEDVLHSMHNEKYNNYKNKTPKIL